METLDAYSPNLALTGIFLAVVVSALCLVNKMDPLMPKVIAPPQSPVVRLGLYTPSVSKPEVAEVPEQQQEKGDFSQGSALLTKPKTEIPVVKEVMESLDPENAFSDDFQSQIARKTGEPENIVTPLIEDFEEEKLVTKQPVDKPKRVDDSSLTSIDEPVTADREASESAEPVREAASPPVESLPDKPEKIIEKVSPIETALSRPADQGNFNLNQFFKRFIDDISLEDYYPSSARRRKQQGTVVVQLTLENQLEIASIVVVRSSRYPNLDQAALEMITDNRKRLEVQLKSHAYSHIKPIRLHLPVRFRLN